jgi:alkyl hydroperoxide reductase subunit AhpC
MNKFCIALALSPLLSATVLALGQAQTPPPATKPAPKAEPQEKKPEAKPEAKKEEPKKEEVKKDEKAAGPALGAPAPDFTLKDLDGKSVKLSDYKGKIVVLEWFNPGCPFVQAAHGKDGPLHDMSKMTSDGVVWLAINSSAVGQEGAGAEANKKSRDEWKISAPVLLDEAGTVGRTYGAKSTPHMFVIDAKGMLAYRGALDNAPQGKLEGDKKINYVEAAISELKAGKPVTTKETKSYGCPVKYAAKAGA